MGLRMKDCAEITKVNGVHEIKRFWEVNGKCEINGKAVANGQPQGKKEARSKSMADSSVLPVYSWEEIQKHNLKTDQWLVIKRKVYNVTKWADRHPGGSQVLNHYAGEDATDVFLAMHLDQAVVQKYLKPLLIGELAPGEPSQEKNKNQVVLCFFPVDTQYLVPGTYSIQLVEDFRVLRKTIEDQKLLEPSLPFFFMHLIQILFLEALVWFILRSFGNGWLITLLISLLLTVSQAQASFLQHDTGHLSIFKKSKWNHLMHYFVMGHLKGMSAKWWNYRHFQHHAKPNIYPKDPDIDMGPLFVLGESQPVKYGKKKIKYINYEKQHLYFYVVGLPLLMPVYFNMQSMQVTFLRKEWGELAWIVSFYIRYFITYRSYYGIIGTVLLIYLVKLLESPWIALVTQMSHIPMKMSKEENQDWFSTQVLATCNVKQSFFNDWFSGHLNFQIEHHLFPTMPRHNYYKIAPLVRSLCAKHGIDYVNKPMLKAFGDIVRSLKKSGDLWVNAYYYT